MSRILTKKIIIASLVPAVLLAGFFVLKTRSLGLGRLRRPPRTYQAPPSGIITQPGDSRGSFVVDGRTRTYLLHVPSGYTGAAPLPLILAFHGYGGNGERMAEVTQLSPLADQENFIVVYPDGFEKSWNHGDGNRPAVAESIDDVQFVRTLIGELEKKLAIDRGRIFATGFSNGALMTERLGCELADVLAGIAPVSGSMPKKFAPACKPAKPIRSRHTREVH